MESKKLGYNLGVFVYQWILMPIGFIWAFNHLFTYELAYTVKNCLALSILHTTLRNGVTRMFTHNGATKV